MHYQLAQQAHSDYVANRVFSAHPAERVYMLYQVAIDSVNTSIARLKDGDILARGRAVNKAHEAVQELSLALDHSVGANFTHTLAGLYDYVQTQLVKGHSQKSEEAFSEALSILTTLTEAWKQVVERTCGGGLSVSDSSPYERVSQPSTEVSESQTAYQGTPGIPSTSRGWSG